MRSMGSGNQHSFSWGILAARFILMALVLPASAIQAQTYSIIHDFSGGNGGNYPFDGVTMDRAGNLYVTTYGGGQSGEGAVFKLTNYNGSWTFTPLYSFLGGNDGAIPYAGVTIGPDGDLYGTTWSGGQGAPGCPGGCGTVYKLSPPPRLCHTTICPWTETILYSFYDSPAGLRNPWAGVIFDAAGNIYGTTTMGGTGGCPSPGCGAVYKLTPSAGGWVASVLYSFTGNGDGSEPYAGVTMSAAGDLYGTTMYGTPYGGYGTVYELMPSGGGWSEKTLYDFRGGSDGGNPMAGLISDSAGNLYGDTSELNGNYLAGTVFELLPSGGGWTYSVLYSFTTTSLAANLSFDTAGNLYGTTLFGGSGRLGSVFKLSNSGGGWMETDLHDFSGQGGDGESPQSPVTIDSAGNLYGTTTYGGSEGDGTVWEITR